MKLFLFLFFCAQLYGIQNMNISNGSRIIGGQEASAGQFPYAAAIYKTTADGTYFCTGSLVSTDWIITAGQCVDGATLFTILLGTHKLNGDEATVQKLATSEYVLHPNFNPATLDNDVGLIKLRMSIEYSEYIQNVLLPLFTLYPGTEGITYGWGQINDDNSDLSDTLNYVTLSALSDTECRMIYGSQLRENMVCYAGNYNEGTCLGDSGSPALYSYKQYHLIVAVSSFHSSNGCESADPSGYTDLYPYVDWIKEVVFDY